MIGRAIYDVMVFIQWASLPVGRQHATIKALCDGTVRLVMSQDALDEIRMVLNRPELTDRLPNLTPERVNQVIRATVELAEWIPNVPEAFTWSHHPDDDHFFNLAIAARADWFVTFEERILNMRKNFPTDAAHLQALAPRLRIVDPKTLSLELRADREKAEPIRE